jgi:hypothetical protein
MNWDQIKGDWNRLSRSLKEKWKKILHDRYGYEQVGRRWSSIGSRCAVTIGTVRSQRPLLNVRSNAHEQLER